MRNTNNKSFCSRNILFGCSHTPPGSWNFVLPGLFPKVCGSGGITVFIAHNKLGRQSKNVVVLKLSCKHTRVLLQLCVRVTKIYRINALKCNLYVNTLDYNRVKKFPAILGKLLNRNNPIVNITYI